jgi:hypothetical protein
MVRSSTISIGAASAPARSSRASWCASCGLSRPVVWKRLPKGSRMVATLMTSSTQRGSAGTVRFAADGPLLAEHHRHRLADVLGGDVAHPARAGAVEVDEHGRLARLLVEAGRRAGHLVAGHDDLALEQDRLPVALEVERRAGRHPAGLLGLEGLRGSPCTRRYSSVAVAPSRSLTLPGSCTPGSSTTMRRSPWRWITGSATPRALTRLRSVVMFCSSASLRASRISSSGIVAVTKKESPSSRTCERRGCGIRWPARARPRRASPRRGSGSRR